MQFPTILGLLQARVDADPLLKLYSAYSDEAQPWISADALLKKAKVIGGYLQDQGLSCKRVILLCSPGLDPILGFWGCIFAGAVAVPVPHPGKRSGIARIRAVLSDCSAAAILGSDQHDPSVLRELGDSVSLRGLTVREIPEQAAAEWIDPGLNSGSTAFIQYTSGSTGSPKGVVVSHSNLLSNAQEMHEAFAIGSTDKAVSWLPIYHDMGLLGGVVQPVYSGYPNLFMSPLSFIERPLRWLEAISKTKATISGGPNFAYELCVQRAGDIQDRELELSAWRVAFNGSESVHSGTIRRFVTAFAPHGFKENAVRPCYGLAEATLLVSARTSLNMTMEVDAEGLKSHKVHELPIGSPGARTLVGVGGTNPSHLTLIVNPETLRPCAEDEVGEIWVSGPSVAQGYWNKQKETEFSFHAHLSDDPRRSFLRTGDLGFLHSSQLFIAGRLKDLIIIRGQNIYPQDIERSVKACHPALHSGRGAAFSVTRADVNDLEEGAGESLIIVHEVHRIARPGDLQDVIGTIREQIATEYQLDVHTILLVRQGSIPRTTSGKVQHGACRQAFLAGTLKIVASSVRDPKETAPKAPGVGKQQHEAKSDSEYIRVAEAIAGIMRVPVHELSPDVTLSALGIDSFKAAQIKVAVETATGAVVPISSLLQGLTMGELAGAITDATKKRVLPLYFPKTERNISSYPLSAGQKALWFLQQVHPESSAYTIARAVSIKGPLDIKSFEKVFDVLCQRHASLRMVVRTADGELLQDVSSGYTLNLKVEDARQWSGEILKARIGNSAREPFQLTAGQVFRVHLFVRSDDEVVMLLCAHHIAVDLWSFATITEEILTLYRAIRNGDVPDLYPPQNEYADFVQWQLDLLASNERERLLNYWRRQLEDGSAFIALPVVRRQPSFDEPDLLHFDLDTDLQNEIHALARSRQVTVNGVLQATFEILLHRYTGQEEFLVGLLSSGRVRKRDENVVGYFVNPVVLRPKFRRNLLYAEYLNSSYGRLLEGLDYSDLPFSILVEQLFSHRGDRHSQPLQVMSIYQPAKIGNGPDLSSFIMARTGGTLNNGDLLFESLAFSEEGTQFDLTMIACDATDKIAAGFKYDPCRFDVQFVQRMAGHYQTLLRDAARRQELPIGSLAILADVEIRQIITSFNDTGTKLRSDVCVHTLIEEQTDCNPEHVAVVYEDETLTYHDLDSRANRLANYLRTIGVQAENRVGLCVERSLDLLVGLLGILKAGAAYVPLDAKHPITRNDSVLRNSNAELLVTCGDLAQQFSSQSSVRCVCLDRDWATIASASVQRPRGGATPENLAYIMHTSGSTGRPKGVMIEHRNVINFCAGMDARVPCGPGDTLLAVTSISFDISVLELLWTLSRGATVVIANDATLNSTTVRQRRRRTAKEIQFSLFYFASAQTEDCVDKYRMLFEGAKLADELGLSAVWTPERHFHDFGGLYSNPSLTSAALAMTTSRVSLRGGSVVLPLHHPVRVAEEWSFVDNISRGRVGVAFASGWHADDFVFAPQNYPTRKEVTHSGIESVRHLWRGGALKTVGGNGNEVEIKIHPTPIQPELPVWVTSAGTPETFEAAARLHANVLTHLLGQELKDVGAKINLYRQTLAKAGKDPADGIVTLMLHTYLDNDFDQVRRKALGPLKKYLHSSLGLIANLVRSLKLDLDLEKMSAKDLDDLLVFAAERYMGTSGLFGSLEDCLELIDSVRGLGVTEIACLIDFGIDFVSTMRSVHHIAALQQLLNRPAEAHGPAQDAPRYEPNILQCTPSYLRMLMHMESGRRMLSSLSMLLLGGEPVPSTAVEEVRKEYPGPILNMYGPTETTIWSAVQPIRPNDNQVLIGGPISNTQLYILDPEMQLSSIGITGEVYIGGNGLARGYVGSPALTAERFLPDPYSAIPGFRLYRTGDMGRLHEDGRIELVGRTDQQVKVRGYRIELGDIEASLNQIPGVAAAVVAKQEQAPGDTQLIAYLVPSSGNIDLNSVRSFLQNQLPPYMIPGKFRVIRELPLTANGKINRMALPSTEASDAPIQSETVSDGLQSSVLDIWKQILKMETISIDDNFFDIGGHSLLMVQVHEQLQRVLQKTFPLMALLQYPTIRGIARFLGDSDSLTVISPAEKALRQRSALISQRHRALAVRK